jgi:hypothetical protein
MPLLIIIAALLLYFPLLRTFFWSDDWYILALSQISSIGEFLRFFSFHASEYATPVYRPLSTEAFYFAMRSLFGLNPVPYHIVAFIVWAVGAFMLYKLLSEIFGKGKSNIVLVALTLFVFSASHFTRLAYISAFQEILMFTCTVSMLYIIQGKTKWHLLCALMLFVTALLSKESAVIGPILIVLIQWFKDDYRVHRAHYSRYVSFFLLLGIYMYLRFVVRGVAGAGSEYAWDFDLLRAVHTSAWYKLWSLGIPEFIIDYAGDGARLIPRFWTDFGTVGKVFVGGSLVTVGYIGGACVYGLFRGGVKGIKDVGFGALWYIAGLLPVIFLPTHKFALGQSVALIGLCIVIAVLMCRLPKRWLHIGIGIYILFNLFSIGMYYSYHVSMQRSQISYKVYRYIIKNYPKAPVGFYFTNSKPTSNSGWGESKQIDQAMSKHFFRVIYKDKAPEVQYEDYKVLGPGELPGGWVQLESGQFL